MATAHLRCGEDLRAALPAAGWAGEYLAFSDPVCWGAVSDDGLMAYLAQRARVVALHAGLGAEAARLKLGAEYAALHALHRFERVLLWFEHDLWDQAALLRVLSLLAAPAPGAAPPQDRLFLMPADGRASFAELPAAALAGLAPQPLTPAQIEAGAEAWAAFAAPDPTALDTLTRRASPLPHLAAAMRRHLMDLPWRSDGLALTERLLLRAIAAGAGDAAAALAALRAADPVFHVTDLIVLDLVKRLSDGPRRLVARGLPWRLSPLGEAVLAGQEKHRSPPRFQAGVAVGPEPRWMWDPRAAGVHHA
jgi:hypothetical protein